MMGPFHSCDYADIFMSELDDSLVQKMADENIEPPNGRDSVTMAGTYSSIVMMISPSSLKHLRVCILI